MKVNIFSLGLHTGPPGFRFIVFPKNYRSLSFDDIKCLNKDGLEIILDVQFQYLARTNAASIRGYVEAQRFTDITNTEESGIFFRCYARERSSRKVHKRVSKIRARSQGG